ncbi:DUF2975 domain-containing protein [Chitinophaga lutea]
MTQTKLIARILFYGCRTLAWAYLLTVAYSILCLLSGWSTAGYGEGRFLHIFYPFTTTPFLNIENNLPYIIWSFLLTLTLYGLFFWLASDVFRVFTRQKLFTAPNVVHLRRFCWFNLAVPGACTLAALPFVEIENMIGVLVAVHFILGVFAYFLAAIFQQGLQLQKEQDLFI